MKIQFVKSLFNIPYDEWQPVAKPEHLGKTARVKDNAGRSLMIILPCGHIATLFGWNVTDIDTDTPSATPSIFCKYDNKDCWHGYLTKGELVQ